MLLCIYHRQEEKRKDLVQKNSRGVYPRLSQNREKKSTLMQSAMQVWAIKQNIEVNSTK